MTQWQALPNEDSPKLLEMAWSKYDQVRFDQHSQLERITQEVECCRTHLRYGG